MADNEIAVRARAALTVALTGEHSFVRIHAGEAVAELGETARVHEMFLAEAEAGETAYRVGVWRLLAASAASPEAAARWARQIEEVIDEPRSGVLLLAVESLNKLRVALPGERLAEVRRRMANRPGADLVFLHWAEHLAGDMTALERIAAALSSPMVAERARAAFVLQQLRPASAGIRLELGRAVQQEPAGTITRVFVLAAALALQVDETAALSWRAELEDVLTRSESDVARYYAIKALSADYGPGDLPRLDDLLRAATGDARVGLAWAILDILARAFPG